MQRIRVWISATVVMLAAVLVVSCGGGGGGGGTTGTGGNGTGTNDGGSGGGAGPTPTALPTGTWTWVGGSPVTNQTGTYGTPGVADPANVPGGRMSAASWVDGSGNFWLFGGVGFSSTGGMTYADLNDLWKFDGTNWTWVKGSMFTSQTGTYGTMGTPSASNSPGAREGAVSWYSGGSMWLFGGFGYAASGDFGWLNDLWKFNGTDWVWVNGPMITNQTGTYGTKGSADPANLPGARTRASSATDGSGNLWLFGGTGYDSTGTYGYLNDLWKFDGTNWTWISGSDTAGHYGVYGTMGTADAANVPGGRISACLWIDSGGTIWLFGGEGLGAAYSSGDLNDLWKFDPASGNWTWMKGTQSSGQLGVYGTLGVAAASNNPGGRYYSACWKDANNNLWVFGGFGYDSLSSCDMNDLWKFDGTNWTWMAGPKLLQSYGTYGTLGVPAATNYPGRREAAATTVDVSGNVWLFGGDGAGAADPSGYLNDLWKYQPPL